MSESIRVDEVPVIRAVDSFEAFYRREYRAVLGLAVVLSGDRSVGEELAQDAFLVTLREWDRVAKMEYPGAWVRRVVVNRSVSRFRRLTAEGKALVRFRSSPVDHEGLGVEVGVDLWREVRRLPRRQAQVIVLTYVDGLARAEIGKILGCSEETVKTHLNRARHTLSKRLESMEGRS